MGDAVGPAGVVVMAYGTPSGPDDVEAYYTHIRRGRPPSVEQLADLRRRYDALGGASTLAARTGDQVARLQAALDEHTGPGRFPAALGQKHAAPFVEDGVAALASGGAETVVGLVLAPHYSAASVGEYHARGRTAADDAGVAYVGIDSWHLDDAYLGFLTTAVADRYSDLRRRGASRVRVLFTAHSLPERVLVDDPYPDQLAESAAVVAGAAGLGPDEWSVAWQSAGATPEPWRGPDILDVVRELAATGACDAVLVCPQGFVADHLEVAYDLDIEARAVAVEAGVAFARTRVLDDDAAVFASLARRVATAADAGVAA